MPLAELLSLAGASACASGACFAVSHHAARILDRLQLTGDNLRRAHPVPPNDGDMDDVVRRLEEAEHASRG